MKHEIDLKNAKIHTNLLVEDIKNLPKPHMIKNNIKLISISINKDNYRKYHKKIGNYKTIEFTDVTDFKNRHELIKVLEEELINMYKLNNIKENDSCMIIGLGNIKSTPDSLGPNVIENIIVTSHIYKKTLGFRKTYAIRPGVKEETGIDTSIILKSIVSKVKPDFVIVIDSLVSRSIKRLNRTIQITDTSIYPGSGLNNRKKEISKKTLNVPVITIGCPTIIETTLNNNYLMITTYEIDFIIKKLSEVISEGINNSLHKILR